MASLFTIHNDVRYEIVRKIYEGGMGIVYEAEQYGAVKMRLFQAFDEIEDMMAQGRRMLVAADSLEGATAKLGVE